MNLALLPAGAMPMGTITPPREGALPAPGGVPFAVMLESAAPAIVQGDAVTAELPEAVATEEDATVVPALLLAMLPAPSVPAPVTGPQAAPFRTSEAAAGEPTRASGPSLAVRLAGSTALPVAAPAVLRDQPVPAPERGGPDDVSLRAAPDGARPMRATAAPAPASFELGRAVVESPEARAGQTPVQAMRAARPGDALARPTVTIGQPALPEPPTIAPDELFAGEPGGAERVTFTTPVPATGDVVRPVISPIEILAGEPGVTAGADDRPSVVGMLTADRPVRVPDSEGAPLREQSSGLVAAAESHVAAGPIALADVSGAAGLVRTRPIAEPVAATIEPARPAAERAMAAAGPAVLPIMPASRDAAQPGVDMATAEAKSAVETAPMPVGAAVQAAIASDPAQPGASAAPATPASLSPDDGSETATSTPDLRQAAPEGAAAPLHSDTPDPVSVEGGGLTPPVETARAAGPRPEPADAAPASHAAGAATSADMPVRHGRAEIAPPHDEQAVERVAEAVPSDTRQASGPIVAGPIVTDMAAATTGAPPPVAAATTAEEPATGAVAPPPEQAIAHALDLAHEGAWLDRLARDIAASAGEAGRLQFQLNPEHLGSLHVEMTHRDDGIAITLTAESDAAHATLAEAQGRLMSEARAHGARIAEARVEQANPVPQQPSGGQAATPAGGEQGGAQLAGQNGGNGSPRRPPATEQQPFVRHGMREAETAGASDRDSRERYA